jgi:hypothetical protein
LARALPTSILAFEISLLETEGVAHDHPPEIEGRLGAEDRAPVTTLREERQPADVVEMGVADDHRIHMPARQHGNLAVLGDGPPAPLVEAAVSMSTLAWLVVS